MHEKYILQFTWKSAPGQLLCMEVHHTSVVHPPYRG